MTRIWEDHATAAKLSTITGTLIEAIDGGFRVKQTPTHYIDVMRMIYNWRVCRTPKARAYTFDRGWCYFGTDGITLLKAVGAALEWDGADATTPAHWDKNAMTGEYADERAGSGN